MEIGSGIGAAAGKIVWLIDSLFKTRKVGSRVLVFPSNSKALFFATTFREDCNNECTRLEHIRVEKVRHCGKRSTSEQNKSTVNPPELGGAVAELRAVADASNQLKDINAVNERRLIWHVYDGRFRRARARFRRCFRLLLSSTQTNNISNESSQPTQAQVSPPLWRRRRPSQVRSDPRSVSHSSNSSNSNGSISTGAVSTVPSSTGTGSATKGSCTERSESGSENSGSDDVMGSSDSNQASEVSESSAEREEARADSSTEATEITLGSTDTTSGSDSDDEDNTNQ
jgi:hypothetical protein